MRIACPNCEHVNEVAAGSGGLCVRCRTALPVPAAHEPAPATAGQATADPVAGDGAGDGDESQEPLPDLELPAPKLAQVRQLTGQIRERPKAVALYLQLEKLYLEAGRRDLAIHLLKRCLLKADPKNATVKARLDVLSRQEQHAARGVAAPVAADGDPGDDISPAPTPVPGPLRARRRRGPSPLVLAGAVVVLLIAGWIAGRLLFPRARPLIAGAFAAQHPSVSPDGKSIAFLKTATMEPKLSIYDMATGETRELVEVSYGTGFVWSPDGRYLAFEADVHTMESSAGDDAWDAEDSLPWGSAVYVVDPAAGKPRRLALGASPSFTPDGTSVAMLCEPDERPTMQGPGSGDQEDPGSRPCVVDVMTRAKTQLADIPARRIVSSPRGDWIAFEVDADVELAFDDGSLDKLVERVADGTTTLGGGERALGREMEARGMSGSSGFIVETANIHVVKRSGSDHRRVTDDGRCAGATFLPDGSLAFVHRGQPKLEILRVAPDGGAPAPLFPASVDVADPNLMTFTPDGRQLLAPLVVGEANPGIAMTMTGQFPVDLHLVRVGKARARRIETPQAFKWSYSLAPDGRWLVYETPNPDTQMPEIWRARL